MVDERFEVHDAGSAAALTAVVPPLFVRYANGGLVAFGTLRQAIQKVAPRDFALVDGAWASRGQSLHFELDDGKRLLVVDAGAASFPRLREALVARLATDGDTDLDELDSEALVARAYGRLELKSLAEMLNDHILPHLLSPG